jgi:hypothetical protein
MLSLSITAPIIAAATASNAVAIVAIVVAGLVGVVGPIVTGIFLSRNTERTITAERDRLRREAIRAVLDQGAALMVRVQEMLGDLRAQGDRVEVPAGFDETIQEVATFQSQLRLWFEDNNEIVKAFDDLVGTSLAGSLGGSLATRPPSVSVEEYQKLREMFAQYSGDVLAQRKRYLDAAREHLRSGAL